MKTPLREPTIIVFPATYVIGIERRFPRERLVDIGSLWQALRQRTDEIANPTGTAAFGIHKSADEPKPVLDYLAGVEVEDLSHVPEGMVGRKIGGGLAAFFLVRLAGGPIGTEIGAAYDHIWRQWMPKSGYVPTVDYDIERYDYRFDPKTLTGIIELVVPIKERK